MQSKQDASFKDQLATILKSYKKAVDTILDEANFLKRATAEIEQLKLQTSQSIKRTEKIQEKILHTKQEFIAYQKKCREKAEKLVKISNKNLPKWLLDEIQAKDQAKTHVKTEEVAETDQVRMLPPVNEVTPAADGRDNIEASSKLEIYSDNVLHNALSDDDVNTSEKNSSLDGQKADGQLNEGTTSEVCICCIVLTLMFTIEFRF